MKGCTSGSPGTMFAGPRTCASWSRSPRNEEAHDQPLLLDRQVDGDDRAVTPVVVERRDIPLPRPRIGVAHHARGDGEELFGRVLLHRVGRECGPLEHVRLLAVRLRPQVGRPASLGGQFVAQGRVLLRLAVGEVQVHFAERVVELVPPVRQLGRGPGRGVRPGAGCAGLGGPVGPPRLVFGRVGHHQVGQAEQAEHQQHAAADKKRPLRHLLGRPALFPGPVVVAFGGPTGLRSRAVFTVVVRYRSPLPWRFAAFLTLLVGSFTPRVRLRVGASSGSTARTGREFGARTGATGSSLSGAESESRASGTATGFWHFGHRTDFPAARSGTVSRAEHEGHETMMGMTERSSCGSRGRASGRDAASGPGKQRHARAGGVPTAVE